MKSDETAGSGANHSPFPLLAAVLGDIAAFLLFAAIGRRSHGESGNGAVLSTLGIALPFIAGWFLAAVPSGAFSKAAAISVRAALRHVALAWIPGGLIGLGIRSLIEGRIVPWTFALVAFLFNLIVLGLWRTGLTLVVRRRG